MCLYVRVICMCSSWPSYQPSLVQVQGAQGHSSSRLCVTSPLTPVVAADHRLNAVSACHILPPQRQRGGLGRCPGEVPGSRERPSYLPQCLPSVEEKQVGY